MNQGIKNIVLYFEDGNKLKLEDEFFSHFYIANIDKEANEICYEKILDTKTLYANFLTLKISNLINDLYKENIIHKIFTNKNLSEIKLDTQSGKTISFNIASTIDPFDINHKNNCYDKSFINEEHLCLLICPYNIKYKNHLFI